MDTKNIQKYFDKKILEIKKLTGGVTNFVFYIVTIDNGTNRILKKFNVVQ